MLLSNNNHVLLQHGSRVTEDEDLSISFFFQHFEQVNQDTHLTTELGIGQDKKVVLHRRVQEVPMLPDRDETLSSIGLKAHK